MLLHSSIWCWWPHMVLVCRVAHFFVRGRAQSRRCDSGMRRLFAGPIWVPNPATTLGCSFNFGYMDSVARSVHCSRNRDLLPSKRFCSTLVTSWYIVSAESTRTYFPSSDLAILRETVCWEFCCVWPSAGGGCACGSFCAMSIEPVSAK